MRDVYAFLIPNSKFLIATVSHYPIAAIASRTSPDI